MTEPLPIEIFKNENVNLVAPGTDDAEPDHPSTFKEEITTKKETILVEKTAPYRLI